MENNTLFGITPEDIKKFARRQVQNGIDNHSLRDTETATFFRAMMSDDADFIKQGFVNKEAIKLLGEDVG